MSTRLSIIYNEKVLPELQKSLGRTNALTVPRVEKIVVNAGVGKIAREAQGLDKVRNNLAKITGQHPVLREARKSIASFKLRKGMPVGLKVTLRGDRMYHFLDRLINVAMPRIHDFRGINPVSVDGRGSLSIGIKEQSIFPELDPSDLDLIHGFEITIHTTAKSHDEGLELLTLLGMPFQKTT